MKKPLPIMGPNPNNLHAYAPEDYAVPPTTPGYHMDCIFCGQPSVDGITCAKHQPKTEHSKAEE